MKTPSILAALVVVVAACGAEPPPSPRNPPSAERDSPMMVIRVVLDVAPEHRDAFVAHLQGEAVSVRAMEGCERFELFADPGSDVRFFLYEEWATAEDFDAYRTSPTFAQSFQVLGPMLAGPPDSRYYAARVQAQP